MKKIEAIVSRADDGTYNVYLEKYPIIFGMGDNVISAKENFLETIRLTEEEIGKESALHKLGGQSQRASATRDKIITKV